jgi:hypothetical protein
VIVPIVEFPPAIPLTAQATAVFDVPTTVVLNCCACDGVNVALDGEILTETPGTTVTLAWPNLLVSATLVALIVTEPTGTVEGAVYKPPLEIVPTVEFPPATPLTLQFTVVLEVPPTAVLNCCVCETPTEALVGDTFTEIPGTTVTPAWANLVASATLVAATVTEPDGTAAGALYKPALDIVPTVEFPPATPLTLQFTAVFDVPTTVALNCWVCKTVSVALVGETPTETDGETVTLAWANLVVSAALVAVIVTEPDGTAAGALYKPALDIVPTVEFPPATPLTLQFTAVFDVPPTVALNCWVCKTVSVALVGETPTETDGETVTLAWANLVVSAVLVAVIVTAPDGTAAGALYKPALEIVPTVEFPPATPLTLQFTAVFAVPPTVALNCFVWDTVTEALVGDTETETAGITVTLAWPDLVASAALVAAIVTAPPGTAAGAVYKPAPEIVPTTEFPPVMPFTDQFTVVLPLTVALNCWVFNTVTVALVGDTPTEIMGRTVTIACANLVGSLMLVAVIVIVTLGTDAGAVYTPSVEIVPTVEFPPATPLIVQVTFVFVDPATFALNSWVWETITDAVVGFRTTACPDSNETPASEHTVVKVNRTRACIYLNIWKFFPSTTRRTVCLSVGLSNVRRD